MLNPFETRHHTPQELSEHWQQLLKQAEKQVLDTRLQALLALDQADQAERQLRLLEVERDRCLSRSPQE